MVTRSLHGASWSNNHAHRFFVTAPAPRGRDRSKRHWASAHLQRTSIELARFRHPKVLPLAPLMGFRSRLTTSDRGLGHPGLTSPSIFPSRAFSAPQGFASHDLLRPCFMPLPPVGFSPPESFPHETAQRPFLARFPHGLTRQRRVWCPVLQRGEHPASLDAFDSS